MKKKLKLGILFGGKSAEHEVSLQSAKNIIGAIDKDKYDLTLIGIDKQGSWHIVSSERSLNSANPPQLSQNDRKVTLVTKNSRTQLINLANNQIEEETLDVIFPIFHGPNGEDGTIQGLLKLANIPFVGCGVLASAIGMDKDIQKRLLKEAGVPVAKFLTFRSNQKNKISFEKVKHELGLPLFVKPANLGSSVGVSKVKNNKSFKEALAQAFQYDHKILIEEFIEGREVEVSVLGNDDPIVSLPGEIIPQKEFYTYEAKYLDKDGALLKIPAKLPQATIKKIQEMAIHSFKTLCCEGMARVDFFLKADKPILNEINTIPGFTKISMYPKLWEISGISYSELIDKLIKLAIERFEREQKLKTQWRS